MMSLEWLFQWGIRRYVSTRLTRALPVYCKAIAFNNDHVNGSSKILTEILTVAVVVIHLSQHIHGVRIERQVRMFHNSEGIQLVPQRALPEDKLRRVGTVQAIHAVRPADPIL
jgi:hypothetical protein